MTTKVKSSAIVTIDLTALDHNVSVIKKYSQNAKILAVIKSDAYGHGFLEIANRLKNQVQGFGVASVNEAMCLRNNGYTLPIIVLLGFINDAELEQCINNQLTPVIHDYYQIELLEKNTQHLSIWLKFDTGMGRLGFLVTDAKKIETKLCKLSAIKVECIVSHLSDADDITSEKSINQAKQFDRISPFSNIEKSLLNSGGLLNDDLPRYDWVRIGLMLYGVSPLTSKDSSDLFLKPVMQLTAPIVSIKTLNKNDSVGYSGITKLKENTKVGVVSIGYGDGLLRNCKCINVIVNGRKTTILGNISMNSIVVDLRNISTKVGDNIVLWGGNNLIEQVAIKADTIPYELLCAMRISHHKYIK